MKRNTTICMTTILIALIMIFSTTAVSFGVTETEAPPQESFEEELLDNFLLPDDMPIFDGQQDDGGMIQPFAATELKITPSFKRVSGKGCAVVHIIYRGASKIKSTIELQVYSKDKKSYVSAHAPKAIASAAKDFVKHGATFSTSATKTYRIKVTANVTKNGKSRVKTVYQTLT